MLLIQCWKFNTMVCTVIDWAFLRCLFDTSTSNHALWRSRFTRIYGFIRCQFLFLNVYGLWFFILRIVGPRSHLGLEFFIHWYSLMFNWKGTLDWRNRSGLDERTGSLTLASRWDQWRLQVPHRGCQRTGVLGGDHIEQPCLNLFAFQRTEFTFQS